jgi:hypothetical protein
MRGPAEIEDARNPGLRDAFASMAEVAGEGEDCPRSEDLWESARGRLGRREQEGVILHLGECTACATAWRLARDLQEGETPAVLRVAPARWFSRAWVPLAAAAVIVAAIGLTVQFRSPEREAASAYRAQERDWIRPLAVEGPLPRDRCLLRWTPGPAGTVYEVRVTTEDLEPVARGRGLDQAEYLVPPTALDRVPRGGKILWQVTAHLPDDSRVDSRSFTYEVQ